MRARRQRRRGAPLAGTPACSSARRTAQLLPTIHRCHPQRDEPRRGHFFTREGKGAPGGMVQFRWHAGGALVAARFQRAENPRHVGNVPPQAQLPGFEPCPPGAGGNVGKEYATAALRLSSKFSERPRFVVHRAGKGVHFHSPLPAAPALPRTAASTPPAQHEKPSPLAHRSSTVAVSRTGVFFLLATARGGLYCIMTGNIGPKSWHTCAGKKITQHPSIPAWETGTSCGLTVV